MEQKNNGTRTNEPNPSSNPDYHHPCKKDLMSGKMIEPLDVESRQDIKGLVENVFGGSGFNGRRLAEAATIWKRMIEKDATVCLTLAGAMTPIGMSGPIITMMEKGFIDFIISTGANLYHDLHRTYNYPVRQGHFEINDRDLHDSGVVRIYDTFIEEDETLLATDACILEAAKTIERQEPCSTADFLAMLGKVVLETAPNPEKSLLAKAYELGVPIYCSAIGDSSIGMNLLIPWLFEKKIPIDPVLDVLETAAVVWASKLNGVVEVGGGHPKNFYMQTQPTLWQILHDNQGGHDFFIQLTTDSPHWGGLSGATPSEAYSWGKVSDPQINNTVVYSCASITLPILAMYMSSEATPRSPKRIMQKKNEWAKALVKRSRENEQVQKDWHVSKRTMFTHPKP